MKISEKLDTYFSLQSDIHKYFGYVEDWRSIPMEDSREYFWKIIGGDERGAGGSLRYAETVECVESQTGDYYEDEIYTQRFLPRWIYRCKKFTLVCVDTHTDMNKFLRIMDNAKEIIK